MNTQTGEIRDAGNSEAKPGEILISDIERRYLEMFKAEDRPELLKEMRSKNNNAKRRARNKIAKASRQRNRK